MSVLEVQIKEITKKYDELKSKKFDSPVLRKELSLELVNLCVSA